MRGSHQHREGIQNHTARTCRALEKSYYGSLRVSRVCQMKSSQEGRRESTKENQMPRKESISEMRELLVEPLLL